MKEQLFTELERIISQYPLLSQSIHKRFIAKNCDEGINCHILKRLSDKESSSDMQQHLPTLERRLAELAPIHGYERLGNILRGATNWDEYQEVLSQLDRTLWFKRNKLLAEIEPPLPHRLGSSDMVLCFSSQIIYCEVSSFQSLYKTLLTRSKKQEKTVQVEFPNAQKITLREEQRSEVQFEAQKVVRNLLEKTKRQLPQGYMGILALDTLKSAKFSYDIRLVAERLFPQREQVTVIGLWSGEDDDEPGWEMKPTTFFLNNNSQFREVGRELIKTLGFRFELIGS